MNKNDTPKEGYLDFEAYEQAKEPHTREKASDWRTAIGLQDVDGLRVSDSLKQTAVKHLEGDITIDEVRDMIKDYYVSKDLHDRPDEETEEADKASANMAKGIDPDVSFLKLFFRNLLLGEHNELKNRYMLVNPPKEWRSEHEKDFSCRTSTEQVPNKLIGQVSEAERKLIMCIGVQEFSLKQIMELIGMKHRPTFLYNYIEPAIKEVVVTLLYPNSPRIPRHKYKLTVKGSYFAA